MAAATDSCSADDSFAGSALALPGVPDSAPAAAAAASAATLVRGGDIGCDVAGLRVWMARRSPRRSRRGCRAQCVAPATTDEEHGKHTSLFVGCARKRNGNSRRPCDQLRRPFSHRGTRPLWTLRSSGLLRFAVMGAGLYLPTGQSTHTCCPPLPPGPVPVSVENVPAGQ